MTRLAIIHTVSGLVPTFKKLTDELMPGVDVFNMVDESLLQNTIRAGHLQPETSRRLGILIELARDAGADAVLVTCSSVGPAVDAARQRMNIPVFRVDQPMADLALTVGKRIGVAATLKTTLEPTAALIRARAEAAGKSDVQIISQLCEGAFEAMVAGDAATHDRIVTEGLTALAAKVDVVVLAQASMARVVESLSEFSPARRVPILSSPRSGVEAVAKALRA